MLLLILALHSGDPIAVEVLADEVAMLSIIAAMWLHSSSVSKFELVTVHRLSWRIAMAVQCQWCDPEWRIARGLIPLVCAEFNCRATHVFTAIQTTP